MQKSRGVAIVLAGEQKSGVAGALETALKSLGYVLKPVRNGDEVLTQLDDSRSEISGVVLDLDVWACRGVAILREIRARRRHLPIIVISGGAPPRDTAAAVKADATDFPYDQVAAEDLHAALSCAPETASPLTRSSQVRSTITSLEFFVGANAQMKAIQASMSQIGTSMVPVLIQGETGSGKEVVARELHAQSHRVNKPFLKVNCAALPSELVESELFGHERGAFTGASQTKVGMFEMADGGTILLDEIGDMDMRLQAKLLQVLQDHEFHRIGGRETIKVDVRVIAATHRDLEQAIAERTFREDLYYRLNVVTLRLPPLRDRCEDIVALTEFLRKKHSVDGIQAPPVTPELARAMMAYHWPGNVRELENMVRRLMLLRDSDQIAQELVAKAVRITPRSAEEQSGVVPILAVRDKEAPLLEQMANARRSAETAAILAALNATYWNRKQAAAMLMVDYNTLLYKIRKLGICKRPPKKSARLESPLMSKAAGA